MQKQQLLESSERRSGAISEDVPLSIQTRAAALAWQGMGGFPKADALQLESRCHGAAP